MNFEEKLNNWIKHFKIHQYTKLNNQIFFGFLELTYTRRMTYLKKHEKPKNQVSGTDIELIFCRATQKKNLKKSSNASQNFLSLRHVTRILSIFLSTFAQHFLIHAPPPYQFCRIQRLKTAGLPTTGQYISSYQQKVLPITVLDILLGICFRSFM